MVVMMQVPSGRQQAPRQALGVHVAPGAASIPAGQAVPASTTHEPLVRQQATPGHGFGLHVADGT